MEVSSIRSSSSMKSMPFFSSSSTPSLPSLNSNILSFHHTLKPKPKGSLLSLTHCSSKPNTNTNTKPQGPTSPISDTNSNNTTSDNASDAQGNPTSSNSSTLYSRGLVLNLGPEDSWDSVEIGSPLVKRFLSDEEERWYMWYHGKGKESSGFDSIGLAISSNGVHWERGFGAVKSAEDAGLVMKSSKDWWAFDTMSIRPCEVVIMSSSKVRSSSAVYWMYYTGFSNEKVKYFDDSLGFGLQNPDSLSNCMVNGVDGTDQNDIFSSLPGLAISQDGRHWARIEGEHHSGALFDVGLENEWDSLFIASPHVVFHGNGDLRMYYHSYDVEKGEFCIGMARSRDGIKWVKLGKVMSGRTGHFDECGVANPHVVRNKKDGKYLMAYEGIGVGGKRSIGLAMSVDGLKDWRRIEEEAILKGLDDDAWDCVGVGSPCLIQLDGDDDQWRLYYAGMGSDGSTGIGMAASEGSDFRRFRRWTGFHL